MRGSPLFVFMYSSLKPSLAPLYDPTMADAICDRIIYNSHTVKIEGDSMRKRGAIAE